MFSGRLTADVQVDVHAGRAPWRSVESGEVLQCDILEGAANAGVDALPGPADAALSLDAAVAGSARAFRDRDRALEYVEDLRRRDQLGRAREAIAALRTARGNDETGTLQTLQDLAHRRTRKPRALGELGGGAVPRRLL